MIVRNTPTITQIAACYKFRSLTENDRQKLREMGCSAKMIAGLDVGVTENGVLIEQVRAASGDVLRQERATFEKLFDVRNDGEKKQRFVEDVEEIVAEQIRKENALHVRIKEKHAKKRIEIKKIRSKRAMKRLEELINIDDPLKP